MNTQSQCIYSVREKRRERERIAEKSDRNACHCLAGFNGAMMMATFRLNLNIKFYGAENRGLNLSSVLESDGNICVNGEHSKVIS